MVEVTEEDDGNTYRAVYTLALSDTVYVLHAFQKKSTKGISTPQRELDLIRQRLKRAQEIHAAQEGRKESGP